MRLCVAGATNDVESLATFQRNGRAVQVDPVKPKWKPPGTKRLKLKCDILLSNFAFKFNLRRYTMARTSTSVTTVAARRCTWPRPTGRGLHSFPFQLNLSRL